MHCIKRSRSNSDSVQGSARTPKRVKPATRTLAQFTKTPDSKLSQPSHVQVSQKPSGGILPTDTFQDIAIESIETSPNPATAGVHRYRQLLTDHPSYPSIGVSIEEYRTELRNPRTYKCLDTHANCKPTFGPEAAGIDFSKAPRSKGSRVYSLPVYKGVTSDPMIPLAIIRVVEKNLLFISFDSALNNLPNVGFGQKYPLWCDDINFIEKDSACMRQPTSDRICVVFLPDYYENSRHAIGFYTRKQPSKRFAAMLFTPCTIADLKDAKLWAQLDTNYAEGSVRLAEGFGWECISVGAKAGEWVHVDVVEEYEAWKAVTTTECDWTLRLRTTLREIKEYSAAAGQRDGGRCWEDWWE
jgi:hypothetical protein